MQRHVKKTEVARVCCDRKRNILPGGDASSKLVDRKRQFPPYCAPCALHIGGRGNDRIFFRNMLQSLIIFMRVLHHQTSARLFSEYNVALCFGDYHIHGMFPSANADVPSGSKRRALLGCTSCDSRHNRTGEMQSIDCVAFHEKCNNPCRKMTPILYIEKVYEYAQPHNKR